MQQIFPINKDIFSNGQMDSKIWLCRELESLGLTTKQKIWILGGWCGIAAFLLLSRERLPIDHIRSFDLDPGCEPIADMINANWVVKNWMFKAFTADANLLEYLYRADYDKPSLVINTSCEHFDSMDWFNKIPQGTIVALQSNNLKHDDEDTNIINSIDEMVSKYQLVELLYQGQLKFDYIDKTFTRFMVIGIK